MINSNARSTRARLVAFALLLIAVAPAAGEPPPVAPSPSPPADPLPEPAAQAPAPPLDPAAASQQRWVKIPYGALALERVQGTDDLEPDDVTKAEIAKAGHPVTGTYLICLLDQGAVGTARAVRGTGYSAYDEKILSQIRSWRFRWNGIDASGRRVCSDVTVSYPPLEIESVSPTGPTQVIPAITAPAPNAIIADELEPPPRAWAFLMRAGLEGGGDTLVDLKYSDGDTSSIRGGGLYSIAAGVLYHPKWPFTVELTFGYKVEDASADNGSAAFSRFPLDLVVSFAGHGHRVGGGGTVHLWPSVSCEAAGCFSRRVSSLDTGYGYLIEYAYGLSRGNKGIEAGLRYTGLRYPGDGDSVDGSSYGIFVGTWL